MRMGPDALLRKLSADPRIEPRVVTSVAQFADEIGDAQVIVLTGHEYLPEVAELVRTRARRLRMIQLLTAGYDRLETLGVPAGVVVANAGDAWSPAVAEHGITMLLALFRQLPMALALQARRSWRSVEIGPLLRSPGGRTLVIVGYGSIGHEAAKRARAFGMHLIGVTRSGRADAGIDEGCRAGDLHAALARADAILLAAPSSPETRGMMNAAAFAACKRGALLVNVSRGNLIVRDALVDALRSGQLGGAAIDVADPEPLPADDPLWDAPNLIITPHVSGFIGPAGVERLSEITGANVLRFLAGDEARHRIDALLPAMARTP
jgi:phosphoglycerate dehydrogenase-like enzyme